MFRDLIESIRIEANERGSLRASYNRSPGASKVAKKGVTRFIRQQTKKALMAPDQDDVNIPRRGIKGYAD